MDFFGFNKQKDKIFKKPIDVPVGTAKKMFDPAQAQDIMKYIASTGSYLDSNQMRQYIANALAIGYFRRTFYRECEASLEHPLVLGAVLLYVDAVTAMSSLTNRSVWVTSEDKQLENLLNQFLEDVSVDERLRDWAGQLAEYGDYFIEPIGKDGLGVTYLDDNIHPADMERIDINGRLEGFVRTGQYGQQTTVESFLEPPWKYVHFRTFGLRKRTMHTTFGLFGQPDQGVQYQIVQGNQGYRVTTRYGTPIIAPSVPVFKRLKMCEDSVLMSRYTRGILWYLYHIKIKGGNFDSASALAKAYATLLKRRQSMSVDGSDQQWKDRFSPVFGQIEDVFVPESDDMEVTVDKMGGEPDIRALADIDLLTNQLLGALRVSKSMLGITDDLPGAFGESAARRISINFAKNAHTLQDALNAGLKRLCQIHLAYLNKNPDPSRFELNFAAISSAEEEELKNGLDTGVDVAEKLIELIGSQVGEENLKKGELLDYINQKILKLDDLDLTKLVKNPEELDYALQDIKAKESFKKRLPKSISGDLYSYLPVVNGKKTELTEAQIKAKVDPKSLNQPSQVFKLNETGKLSKITREWKPSKLKLNIKEENQEANK